MPELSIRDLTEMAFPGIKPLNMETLEKMPAKAESRIGNPIYFPCRIGQTELPGEPVIDIREGFELTLTPFGGAQGAFVEEDRLKNPEVRIRGVIVDENDIYPEDQIRELREELISGGKKEVACDYLAVYDINKIYIQNIKWPEMPGFIHVQPFEIQAIGVQDIELEEIDG